MTDTNLSRLHGEYVQRMKAHPPSTWSSSLLAVVNHAVDIEFGAPSAEAPRRLQVVR